MKDRYPADWDAIRKRILKRDGNACMFCGKPNGKRVEQVLQPYAWHDEENRAWRDARLFQTRIRRNIRLAEAPSFGQSIFDYAPDSHGAEDYTALSDEVDRAVATGLIRRVA